MTRKSEADLEDKLLKQLHGLGYRFLYQKTKKLKNFVNIYLYFTFAITVHTTLTHKNSVPGCVFFLYAFLILLNINLLPNV